MGLLSSHETLCGDTTKKEALKIGSLRTENRSHVRIGSSPVARSSSEGGHGDVEEDPPSDDDDDEPFRSHDEL